MHLLSGSHHHTCFTSYIAIRNTWTAIREKFREWQAPFCNWTEILAIILAKQIFMTNKNPKLGRGRDFEARTKRALANRDCIVILRAIGSQEAGSSTHETLIRTETPVPSQDRKGGIGRWGSIRRQCKSERVPMFRFKMPSIQPLLWLAISAAPDIP